jgi:23S rRNA pseudouridine1911/1915/1917 synthase
MEKAYKLLAQQENISNGAAKKLIDNGLVFVGNKKSINCSRRYAPQYGVQS